jgi:hypothetical protein
LQIEASQRFALIFPSEFFRPDHCHEQVDEQQQGNDADNDGFHKVPLQFVAEANVKAAHDEKGDDHPKEDQVTHKARFTLET